MSKSNLDKLPSNGQWKKSEKKKFQETILLVPFFGAAEKNLNPYAEFLNELGYDCVLFHLEDQWHGLPTKFLSSRSQFGLKYVWADHIEGLLNEIPGKKIIYAFSNPSASAIEAVARRSAFDIKGMVCDSGPSGQLRHSMLNFFTHDSSVPFYPAKIVAATAAAMLWHPRYTEALYEDLKKFPEGFPLLSIRGWKDPLNTPKMIDQVFNPHPQIDWKKLSLPEAAHLDGLKDFPDQYSPAVASFLEEIATPLK